MVTLPSVIAAQGTLRAEDLRVGSEEERYLRALSVLAPSLDAIWTIRPVAGDRMLASLAGVPGPWPLDTSHRALGVRGASADLTFNSGRPFSRADGPAWAGKGASLRASGVLEGRRGILRVRLAPMLWGAENAAFTLVPTAGPFPYSDAAAPWSIDLPQRFGDQSLARLEPGESSIALQWTHARVAFTTAAAQLGSGSDHSLLLQGDGGGFPRLEAGFPSGIRTRLGVIAGQAGWGRNPQTAWAPTRRTGALYSSYVVGTWRPPVGDRIELGVARFFHRDWNDIRLRDLLVPFGSIHTAKWVGGKVVADNQLGSIFARLRVPEAGLEFFGEFGKNDRSRDLRDQAVELEHNAAWLLGAQKVWRDARERLWAMNITAVSGSISPITRFRPQAFFYEHGPLAQGHTVRGQLLGTPLLQREGGGELRIDRYDAAGRVGLVLRTRALPNERAESIAPENVRQEWSAVLEWMRWTRTGAWSARVGGVADMGHSPTTGDAYGLHLGLGYAVRR